MDRSIVERRLVQHARDVAEGEKRVADLRERVVALQQQGRDTTMALALLGRVETLLAMDILDRDKLERELANRRLLD